MSVSGITSDMSSVQAQSDTVKTVGKSNLDRNDFMTLFVTQMQYQDPLKPMDSYQMASQLAQFSSMDATMKMSDNMEKLLDYQTSQNNLQLLSLIGNEVTVKGNGIGVTDGEVCKPDFVLNAAAESCTADIYDAAGHLVRTLDMGALKAGKYSLDWDGKDGNGTTVDNGAYFYKIKALDVTGKSMDVETHTAGHVTGVDFSSGGAQLTIANYINASVGDVISVK